MTHSAGRGDAVVISEQVAIVTGASSGIGEATALALAGRGASVVLAARRADRLDELARRITADGGRAVAIPCDVTDRIQVERLVERAMREFGRIDILINNAGVMPVSPIAERRFDDWDRMLDVNVKGALYMIGCCLPAMLERKSGHIVNLGSVAGRIVIPGNAVYCATKHALHAISEGLRAELAQSDPPVPGIRVTTIAPGVVATELPDSTTRDPLREQVRGYYRSFEHPLTSEDIAQAILYAIEAPDRVNVNEILLRPAAQAR